MSVLDVEPDEHRDDRARLLDASTRSASTSTSARARRRRLLRDRQPVRRPTTAATGDARRSGRVRSARTRYADFTPMIFDGTHTSRKPQVTRRAGRTRVTRCCRRRRRSSSTRVSGTDDSQLGYVLRKVDRDAVGRDLHDHDPRDRALLPLGRQAGVLVRRALDRRSTTTSTDADAADLGFTGATDPGFPPTARKGAANLYLMDLATGVPARDHEHAARPVRAVPALPQRRLDLLPRPRRQRGHEYIVASDAALLAE